MDTEFRVFRKQLIELSNDLSRVIRRVNDEISGHDTVDYEVPFDRALHLLSIKLGEAQNLTAAASRYLTVGPEPDLPSVPEETDFFLGTDQVLAEGHAAVAQAMGKDYADEMFGTRLSGVVVTAVTAIEHPERHPGP
ncbi:hypothetical protein ACQPZF_36315 [Actinosynnema sp. CS-041913]|uniref:hypothetical protein n=1 Tax=Actinosynnema sp. CS-041913 TaxID=3239917 RepID=UPI003D8F3F76